MDAWYAQHAWLPQGVRHRVLVQVQGGRIAAVTTGVDPPSSARRLPGLVIPGLANVHSHAFQRAMRGHAQPRQADGDFWTWREQMYRLAGTIDVETMHALARATYAEMALAGVTAVGEFHYVHHGPDGRPYEDPNLLGRVLIRAAAEAGIRITLLDTCYLRAGLDDSALTGAQRRFGDPSAAAWVERVSGLGEGLGLRIGAAVHSVRAVDEPSIAIVATWARERQAPLHVHVSEQPRENEECRRATGRTPAALLAAAGALGPGTTAVHATHLTAADIRVLGETQTNVCLCPTTERDLADGIGPAAELDEAGSPICLGSDSHAVIDLFEEARAVELDERLASGRRGHHPPERLLTAATAAGMAALGWEAGHIAPGQLADLVAIDLGSVRLAGWDEASLAAQVVYAAGAADVTDVVVGGRRVVERRRHRLVGDVAALLAEAIGRARSL